MSNRSVIIIYIYIHDIYYMKSADLFEIDFYISHFFKLYMILNINHRYKILFNLWVRYYYIYIIYVSIDKFVAFDINIHTRTYERDSDKERPREDNIS